MTPKFIVFFGLFLIFASVVLSQCDDNTECKCPVGLSQGQYCGKEIGCKPNNVYECNPSGGTCEYGYRESCAKCNALSCPPSTPSKPPPPPPPPPPSPPPPPPPPPSPPQPTGTPHFWRFITISVMEID